MTAAAHRKALVKLLQQASYRLNLWDVFSDFLAMASISVSNVLDCRQREANVVAGRGASSAPGVGR